MNHLGMMMTVLVRDGKDTDCGVISDRTKTAFEAIETSNQTKQFIVEALRSAKALALSLVVEVDGFVVNTLPSLP
jgi:putative acetyltransferase